MFRAPVNWSPKLFAMNSGGQTPTGPVMGDKLNLVRSWFWYTCNLHPWTNHSGILVIVPGHALVGHNMSSVLVGDEFECQLKCIHTQPCKSFNVHFSSNQANKHVCELNNQTREMKPSDFKARKGSNYYGPVQVSRQLMIFLQPPTEWDSSRLCRRHKLSPCITFIITSYTTQSANGHQSNSYVWGNASLYIAKWMHNYQPSVTNLHLIMQGVKSGHDGNGNEKLT